MIRFVPNRASRLDGHGKCARNFSFSMCPALAQRGTHARTQTTRRLSDQRLSPRPPRRRRPRARYVRSAEAIALSRYSTYLSVTLAVCGISFPCFHTCAFNPYPFRTCVPSLCMRPRAVPFCPGGTSKSPVLQPISLSEVRPRQAIKAIQLSGIMCRLYDQSYYHLRPSPSLRTFENGRCLP